MALGTSLGRLSKDLRLWSYGLLLLKQGMGPSVPPYTHLEQSSTYHTGLTQSSGLETKQHLKQWERVIRLWVMVRNLSG